MTTNSHYEMLDMDTLAELKEQIQLLKAQVELLEEVQKSLIKRARRLEDERKEK